MELIKDYLQDFYGLFWVKFKWQCVQLNELDLEKSFFFHKNMFTSWISFDEFLNYVIRVQIIKHFRIYSQYQHSTRK